MKAKIAIERDIVGPIERYPLESGNLLSFSFYFVDIANSIHSHAPLGANCIPL